LPAPNRGNRVAQRLDHYEGVTSVTVQRQILSLLRELQVETSMAMLFVTHDLGVVAEICDRTVVMYAGEAVESGPTSALFERPRHLYTAGLIAAVPQTSTPGEPLRAIDGHVPALTERPEGCQFAARCAHVEPTCRAARPR